MKKRNTQRNISSFFVLRIYFFLTIIVLITPLVIVFPYGENLQMIKYGDIRVINPFSKQPISLVNKELAEKGWGLFKIVSSGTVEKFPFDHKFNLYVLLIRHLNNSVAILVFAFLIISILLYKLKTISKPYASKIEYDEKYNEIIDKIKKLLEFKPKKIMINSLTPCIDACVEGFSKNHFRLTLTKGLLDYSLRDNETQIVEHVIKHEKAHIDNGDLKYHFILKPLVTAAFVVVILNYLVDLIASISLDVLISNESIIRSISAYIAGHGLNTIFIVSIVVLVPILYKRFHFHREEYADYSALKEIDGSSFLNSIAVIQARNLKGLKRVKRQTNSFDYSIGLVNKRVSLIKHPATVFRIDILLTSLVGLTVGLLQYVFGLFVLINPNSTKSVNFIRINLFLSFGVIFILPMFVIAWKNYSYDKTKDLSLFLFLSILAYGIFFWFGESITTYVPQFIRILMTPEGFDLLTGSTAIELVQAGLNTLAALIWIYCLPSIIVVSVLFCYYKLLRKKIGNTIGALNFIIPVIISTILITVYLFLLV